MAKRRVFCLLTDYPTLSQTYKDSELRYLQADYEVMIASYRGVNMAYSSHFPFHHVKTMRDVHQLLKVFRPDVIHGHYLHTTDALHRAAEIAGVPFTVRTHSFDVLGRDDEHIRRFAVYLQSELCIGVLAFPFLRERLTRCGVPDDKIIDSWPVVDFDRFHDRAPNGDSVMNTGACIPKKNMNSFVDLARMTPSMAFRMFPIGYESDQLKAYNQQQGSPVTVKPVVEPYDMPRVYKNHRWLVYTANPAMPTIGWPLSIAEAQAAGTGVLVHRVRDDLRDYVGPGGYVYDSLEEAHDILNAPFPDQAREASFEQARRSDIRRNIGDLTALWEALPIRRRNPARAAG